MAMQTFKMFICVNVGAYNRGGIELQSFKPCEDGGPADFGRRLIQEVDVEVDVPEFDVVGLEVVALEKTIQKERADSQVRVNLLLDRLSKLKAIGHDAPVKEGM